MFNIGEEQWPKKRHWFIATIIVNCDTNCIPLWQVSTIWTRISFLFISHFSECLNFIHSLLAVGLEPQFNGTDSVWCYFTCSNFSSHNGQSSANTTSIRSGNVFVEQWGSRYGFESTIPSSVLWLVYRSTLIVCVREGLYVRTTCQSCRQALS